MKVRSIKWIESNPRNDPPLHIADAGERYSTVTGVAWLNDHLFVAAHRNGMKIGLFDTQMSPTLIENFGIPHLCDSIAAKKISEDIWELAVSGCWEYAYSKYLLKLKPRAIFEVIDIKKSSDKTFCHGVKYDQFGTLVLSFSTGQNPRIERNNFSWYLPYPYGVRDTCINPKNGQLYALAVSQDPKSFSYQETKTAIFSHQPIKNTFQLIFELNGTHSDSCKIFNDRLWLGDQKSSRVLGINLTDHSLSTELKGGAFSFPHGLDISDDGMLAVTNYGNSSISIFDISKI